jgi:hypothetical protein
MRESDNDALHVSRMRRSATKKQDAYEAAEAA